MRALKIGVVLALLAGVSLALNEHKSIWFKSPLNRIQGHVVDAAGDAIDLAEVNIWTHPEVWSDDSLSYEQKRSKQRKVETTSTDDHGKFYVKKLPRGSYEVEFKKDGFNDLSVIVQVDSSAPSERFCVKLTPGSEGNDGSFQPCKH